MSEFEVNFNLAKQFSFSGNIIIEELIQKKGYQMDGDGFVWQGKLVFSCFGNQHNNVNAHPFVPVGISFPYHDTGTVSHRAAKQVDDILTRLDMRVGGVNLEYIVDQNDQIYLLEIGPRSGGNLIPEVIKHATQIDLIASCVEGALGKDGSDIQHRHTEGFFASYILHAVKDGHYKDTFIDEKIRPHIIEHKLLVKPGDGVHKFTGSNHTLGTFILKFDSLNEMLNKMDSMDAYIYPIID
jgi:biotin carboxylase